MILNVLIPVALVCNGIVGDAAIEDSLDENDWKDLMDIIDKYNLSPDPSNRLITKGAIRGIMSQLIVPMTCYSAIKDKITDLKKKVTKG